MKKTYAAGLAWATELLGLELGLLYLGQYVDGKMGTRGIFTAAGCFLGLVIWLGHLVIITKSVNKDPQ